MNIQIFGTSKCFDTKKAQRYFKERGVKFQSIDLKTKGMSKGEYASVIQAIGGWEKLVNDTGKDKDLLALIKYLSPQDRDQTIMEHPELYLTPIVRNGKKATVGYQPQIWKDWEAS